MGKQNLKSKTTLIPPTQEKLRELERHPYYRSLMEKSLLPVVQAERKAKSAKKDFLPTLMQQYHIDVFYHSNSLFEAVKRLYDIPYFTFNNPSFKSLTNNGVTPEDWFDYHYANFRVVATGIYDTALIVTNSLFRIDYPSKDCTDKKIRRHPKVLEKQVDIPLAKLKIIISKYREERNFYVHRSERPELEFVDQLKAYRFLKEASEITRPAFFFRRGV